MLKGEAPIPNMWRLAALHVTATIQNHTHTVKMRFLTSCFWHVSNYRLVALPIIYPSPPPPPPSLPWHDWWVTEDNSLQGMTTLTAVTPHQTAHEAMFDELSWGKEKQHRKSCACHVPLTPLFHLHYMWNEVPGSGLKNRVHTSFKSALW